MPTMTIDRKKSTFSADGGVGQMNPFKLIRKKLRDL